MYWFIIVLAGLPIIFKGLDAAGKTTCRWCKVDVRRDAKLCAACGRER
jgi:hypothetical protein